MRRCPGPNEPGSPERLRLSRGLMGKIAGDLRRQPLDNRTPGERRKGREPELDPGPHTSNWVFGASSTSQRRRLRNAPPPPPSR